MSRRKQRRIKANTREEAILKLRVVGLCLAFATMLGLLAAAWFLKPKKRTLAQQTSVLEKKFDGPEFDDGSTSQEILSASQEFVNGLAAKYPEDPKVLNVAARKAMQIGDTENATKLFEQSCSMCRHEPEALYGLGMIAFEKDEYERALGFFEDVAIVSPGDPRVPLAVAECLFNLGKLRESILVLEQHIASEQTSVEAWLQLGQANLQIRNFERALICYKTAAEFSPDSKDAVYGLARSYAGLGKRDESKQLNQRFRELAQLAREENAADAHGFKDSSYAKGIFAQAYVDAHRVELAHGDRELAIEYLLRAVKLEPNNIDWLRELRQLYEESLNHFAMVNVAEEITKIEPENVEDLISLGGAYANLDQAEDAIATFQRAIEIDPQNPQCVQAQRVIDALNEEA